MYAVSTYHKDEWYMTWQGLVVFEYGFKIHDRNNYCMDTFQNKLELDRSFHLFICLKKPDKFDLKKQIKSETNKISIRYAIFIFFNCRMYYSITVQLYSYIFISLYSASLLTTLS